MKKFIIVAVCACFCFSIDGFAKTYNPYHNPNIVSVKGYTRSNGTYVKPHIRTAPNNITTDNLYR